MTKKICKYFIKQYISTLKTNMAKEKVNFEFRLKEVDETRNYLQKEIKHNVLMSERHKKWAGLEIFLSIFLFLFLLSVVVYQFLLSFH